MKSAEELYDDAGSLLTEDEIFDHNAGHTSGRNLRNCVVCAPKMEERKRAFLLGAAIGQRDALEAAARVMRETDVYVIDVAQDTRRRLVEKVLALLPTPPPGGHQDTR